MRERILITGGSGFIGAFLAHDLVAQGHDVHLLLRPDHQTWRLRGLAGRFTPHVADLRDADAVLLAIKACRPHVIYHLATHGAYPHQTDRADILATNIAGTINLLEALATIDYRALVHAGSSSEYGFHATALREDTVLRPRTDYAVAKAAATHLCLMEAHKGRPASVVRVFSAYGPWEEPTRLVPYVMDCCRRGVRPQVTAGTQPRDFIAVSDVANLLQLAAHCPEAHGQILNAGTGIQTRVRDMVETILAVCSAGQLQADFGSERLRADEPTCWQASIAQTTALTGWKPRHSLASGIQAMWTWRPAAKPQRGASRQACTNQNGQARQLATQLQPRMPHHDSL